MQQNILNYNDFYIGEMWKWFKFIDYSNISLKKYNGHIFVERITVNYKNLKSIDLSDLEIKEKFINTNKSQIIGSAAVMVRRYEKIQSYLRNIKEYEYDINIDNSDDLSVTVKLSDEAINMMKSLETTEGVYYYITNYKVINELRDESNPNNQFFGYHVEIGITSHGKSYDEIKGLITNNSIIFQDFAVNTLKKSSLFKKRGIKISDLKISSIVLTRDERLVFKFDLK